VLRVKARGQRDPIGGVHEHGVLAHASGTPTWRRAS
jgi:hypothetical protein